VEGFAPNKHLAKADGTVAKTEETIDFKVIEFAKESKKIIVSHARTHEEEKAGSPDVRESESTEKRTDDSKKVARKVKETQEKSTLGDLDVLANLKSDMEQSEKAAAKKTKK
jgi:small subunit ribosomal protein S1